MNIRKHLSASGLFRLMRKGFDEIKEHRVVDIQISLRDALMSAFAMFSLKEPSILAYDERRLKDSNLHRVYGIKDAAGV